MKRAEDNWMEMLIPYYKDGVQVGYLMPDGRRVVSGEEEFFESFWNIRKEET